MAFELPAPKDPTGLMQEAMRQRLAILAQPQQAPLGAAIAQGVAGLANTGADAYVEHVKKQKVKDAMNDVASYLALPPDQRANPDNHAKAVRGMLALGIEPPELKAKPRVELSTEASKAISDNYGTALPPSGRYYEDEVAGLKLAKPTPDPSKKELTPAQQLARDKFSHTLAKDIEKTTDFTIGPRGSLLGTVGLNNARANRALTALEDPAMVSQQLNAAEVDLSGLFQGGAPHEVSVQKQSFDNWKVRWANIRSFISATPQAINTPEVQAKLKQIITDVKKMDNNIVLARLKRAEALHASNIKKYLGEDWKNYKAKMLRDLDQGIYEPMKDEAAPGAPAAAPAAAAPAGGAPAPAAPAGQPQQMGKYKVTFHP